LEGTAVTSPSSMALIKTTHQQELQTTPCTTHKLHSRVLNRRRRRFLHWQRGPLWGSSSPLWLFEPARDNPIKLAYNTTHVSQWLAT